MKGMRRGSRWSVSAVAGVGLVLAISVSAGSANAADDARSTVAINAASASLSLFYVPVKLTYSILGLTFGGIAYGLSGGDSDVLRAVVQPAVFGDYLVLPEHLRRQRALEFIGRAPAPQGQAIVDSNVYEENY